jgi:SAM-dependent methyltransferase
MLSMHSVVKRNDCRLCEGKLEKMFSFTPTPPGDKYLPKEDFSKKAVTYPLDVVLCNRCGLLQLAHTVSPEILYKDYIYLTSNSLGLDTHFKEYAREVIKDIKIPKKSLVIDVGCNDGTLLAHFKNFVMKPLGIEPASKVAEITKERGIPVINDFLNLDVSEKIVQRYGKASVITANNVLANIDEVGKMIKNVKGMLSPEGVFIFETGYMPSTIKNNIFDNFYHEHLSYFSVKPLESFFRTEGMELIDVKHFPTKGGSIRGVVKFINGREKESHSVKRYLDIENQMRIDQRETFEFFYQKIKKEGEKMVDVIKSNKSKGKSIAGYGASVGVTTMLYEWNLGNLIDFLVDDNSLRHNLMSPGLGIPVFSPDILKEKERKPEAVCILAWRYSNPIINKNREYLKMGGKFIVPFLNSDITKTY